ncbi:sugar porter family MFS transporter [Aestuariivivens sp. NBU2969]|uniref:sugar porter family MFS transporter n=1 Tax=Aestuariivivens sp. NBU2969 TaxID=2873267 RepID=UPI0021052512|nr:sugar porter family MFS transporter [Aestuariivivens sp. NBU2969]
MQLTTAYSEKGNKRFLALICFVASLGGVLFGFDTAVISGTFTFVESYFSLSKIEVGWFASSALVGAIAGAAIAGALSDKYGRKPVLMVAALLFFVSAFGSAIPQHFVALIFARLIGGIGVGIASVLAPLYISEVAPPKIRGRLVALYQLSIVIGILLAYFSNWWLLNISHNNDLPATVATGIFHKYLVADVWRGMFGSEMIPSGLFILLLFLIPESPRWLIKNGLHDKGYAILLRISGVKIANTELEEIRQTDNHVKGKISELIKPGLRLALIVGVGLSVFGQFTGVNIIVYYGPTILESAGFKLDSALQFQVAIGIINLIFTIIALWKIDSWGRRPLLIWGMASVFVSLFIIATQFLIGQTSGIWIVIMLSVYMASLAISINAVIWVLIGEIFPTRIRGRAMSIATFVNWGINFLTAFVFPWYVAKIGMAAGFFTFAAMCLLATMFFYRYVPETRGKSLEEIEEFWKAKNNNI